MPRNETKAKRDVGKRNSSTKSIHQRPRSRSFALLFVVVVVSNLLRPLTPRRITHRNDPPRNGETERERETSIRSARGIKRAPSTFTYDLNCLPGDPPRFHGILALHRIPFSLRGFVCTWLFPRTSSFLSLFFFSSCFSSPMTRRKVEARARRIASTRCWNEVKLFSASRHNTGAGTASFHNEWRPPPPPPAPPPFGLPFREFAKGLKRASAYALERIYPRSQGRDSFSEPIRFGPRSGTINLYSTLPPPPRISSKGSRERRVNAI